MYIGRIAKKIMKLEDLHYQILKAIILTIKHRFYFNTMGKIIVISIIGIWISIWRGKKNLVPTTHCIHKSIPYVLWI